MSNKFQESIHQEFERFMRDEMDDFEKKSYLKSERYKKMIKECTEILVKGFRKQLRSLRRLNQKFGRVGYFAC